MQFVHADDAPQPNGHYSQAVVANGLVFVSAQLPIIPSGVTPAIPADIREQALQALRNVVTILDAAGSAADRLVSATVYVTDIDHWPEVDEAFRCQLVHKPARAVVVSTKLHLGALVAIQAIGVCSA